MFDIKYTENEVISKSFGVGEFVPWSIVLGAMSADDYLYDGDKCPKCTHMSVRISNPNRFKDCNFSHIDICMGCKLQFNYIPTGCYQPAPRGLMAWFGGEDINKYVAVSRG